MSKSKTNTKRSNQQKLTSNTHIVDRFTISLQDRDLLLKKIEDTQNVLRTFPGFCQNFVFEQITDDGEFSVIAITEWENQELLDRAIKAILQFPDDVVFTKTDGNGFEIEEHEHDFSQIEFVPDETVKNTVTDRIETCHSEFMSCVDTLSENALTREIIGKWSIKDYIMHLAMWQSTVTHLLIKEPRYKTMDISKKIWDTQDNDKINAALIVKHSDMTTSEVFNLFKTTQNEFIEKVNELTIDELMLPYNHYDKTSDNTSPVASLVTGIGIYHISNHHSKINEALNQFN